MLIRNVINSIKHSSISIVNRNKLVIYGHNNIIYKSNTLFLYGNNNTLISCSNIYDVGKSNKFSNSLIIKSPDESLRINNIDGNNFYHGLRYDFGSDFIKCDKTNGEIMFHGVPFISENKVSANVYFNSNNFYINHFMIPKSNDLKKIIITGSNIIYVKENIIYFV